MSSPSPAPPTWALHLRGLLAARLQWLARRPLVACAVCFLLGIVLADRHLVGVPAAAAICLLGALVGVAGSRRMRRASAVGVLVAFAGLGGLLHAVSLVVPGDDISHLTGADGLRVSGVVLDDPSVRGSSQFFRLRVQSVSKAKATPSRMASGTATVRVPSSPRVQAGDGVRLAAARVGLVSAPVAPGEFDYARWLQRQGVTARITARAVAVTESAEPVGGPAEIGLALRERVVQAIERAMPGPDPELYAGLLVGMVYGLTAAPLPEHAVDEFRRAGTVHLLVVSGAQVTMLVAAVLWLAGARLHAARWWHLLSAGLAILLLVLIVGLGASVARAVAMFVLFMVAALSGRDYDLATAIALAAAVICLFDTDELFSLGFQLTFAATIGVATFLPSRQLLMLNRAAAPAPTRALRAVLWGTVGAWALVTPLLAHSFGGFAVLGNIANLVNVPLSGVVMVIGFLVLPLAIVASWLPWLGWLITALCGLARLVLEAVMGVNWLAGSLPLAYVEGVHLSPAGCVVWYVVVAAVVWWGLLGRGQRWLDRRLAPMHPSWPAVAAAAVVALILLSDAFAGLSAGETQVTFLPMGAGQCAVVRSPSGATMMVDCGGAMGLESAGERLGANVVRPWLLRHRIRRLDLVAISHWDADHYNSLPTVLSYFGHGRLLLPPELPDASPPPELRRLLDEEDVQIVTGGVIHLGGGVSARVLGPRLPLMRRTEDDANNNSAVLLLSCGARRFLFTGDLEQAGIQRLVRDAIGNGTDLSCDVLCLPHHGRALRSCAQLLALTRPRWAVASCNRRADDYLDVQALGLLRARGVTLLRTDRSGAITFTTDGSRLRLTTSRPQAAPVPAG
ncbi:MAG TPA: ComEC/Rec2 family competence protein [Armatimonadota bacterium]|nr:ComEC/Rec2 family competence protein [Armatimonadota bacterium]